MKIANGLDVRLEYELKVRGGDVIETSTHRGPLTYRHGVGKMLAGLERRLDGMGAGEEKTGIIPASEAFGDEATSPIKEMPRSGFPADPPLNVGQLFEAKGPGGAPVTLKVVSASKQDVKVRLLHPLAGKDIEFRVKVLSVSAPSAAATAPPPPVGAIPELDPDDIREG
jgi:FKBP-type peptidyl-prolyl cis-trans isomerase SlyD